MIDIHSHLVFGVDDGASSFEVASSMLNKAHKDNIDEIVCSSHYHASMQNQYFENYATLQK